MSLIIEEKIVLIFRFVFSIAKKKNLFYAEDLIPFALPLAMYLFGLDNLPVVLKTWMLIIFAGSFFFGLIGLNAGHHNIHTVHEGDTLRQVLRFQIFVSINYALPSGVTWTGVSIAWIQ